MRILVDTNILARLAQPAHDHHPIALSAMAALDGTGRAFHFLDMPSMAKRR
jgi:predicted nucleic acid-binding protein